MASPVLNDVHVWKVSEYDQEKTKNHIQQTNPRQCEEEAKTMKATCHQEVNKSKATSSLFPSARIVQLDNKVLH